MLRCAGDSWGFCGAKVTCECGECGGGSAAENVNVLDLAARPVAAGFAVAKEVLQFKRRCTRDGEKMGEFLVLVSAKPLGDVARYGAGGITNLIAEFEVVMNRPIASNRMHPSSKSVRKAPNIEIFES